MVLSCFPIPNSCRRLCTLLCPNPCGATKYPILSTSTWPKLKKQANLCSQGTFRENAQNLIQYSTLIFIAFKMCVFTGLYGCVCVYDSMGIYSQSHKQTKLSPSDGRIYTWNWLAALPKTFRFNFRFILCQGKLQNDYLPPSKCFSTCMWSTHF